MRTIAVVTSALVVAAAGTGPAAARVRAAEDDLRLIALPLATAAPSPLFLTMSAAGRDVIVGENGPHVWRWRDGLTAAAPQAENVDPSGCGDRGGVDDVAAARGGEFYAVNDCILAASGEYEWSSDGATWNPGLHGGGHLIDADNDGGVISTDAHRPNRLYFVSHTLAGPGLLGGAVIFRKSTDGGVTWTSPAYVNAPTNYPAAQRSTAIELEGPDIYTRAAVDPRNARHITVGWIAESLVDTAQDHADDYTDHYEWDTSAHVANSYDGGRTWSAQTILDSGQHPVGTPHSAYNDLGGWYPSLASGPNGVLYFGVTEMLAGTKVWQPRVMRSLNGGRTWSRPVSLPHAGSAFASSIAVWRGQLVTGWYSSDTPDAGSPKSEWTLELSRYTWARGGTPRLVASVHTGVVHVGVEQPIGGGQDMLHDNVDLAVDGDTVLAPVAIGDGSHARPYLVVWRPGSQ